LKFGETMMNWNMLVELIRRFELVNFSL